MKRIVTIQDISCVGKCSLTVALPIISAMGIETAVVPTAVLSTHTAFADFTFRDLTADITDIMHHWKQQDMHFDAIYTGYLGSPEQVTCVEEMIDSFGGDNVLVLIDPVMGDNGHLYTGFTAAFAAQMATLCSKADVIVPNLTEATAMLGLPYTENCDINRMREILRQLTALGAKKAVLTGVTFPSGEVGVMAYDRERDTYFSYSRERITKNFHGTGDVFASTLTGALTNGLSLEAALQLAVDFTVESIQKNLKDPDAAWYGVNFEQALPMLIERIK